MRRHALVPADRGLLARMVLAAVVTPLIVLAGLVLVVLAAPTKVIVVVAIASIFGIGAAVKERRERPLPRVVSQSDAPELHAIVERLCLLADLPKPEIAIESEAMPNSWIVGTGGRGYRLHLTRGLLDRLEPHELEAVIGHELAHVTNRDAAVMTVVGGPGAVLLGGGRSIFGFGWFLWPGALAAVAIGFVATLGTRALSRYREFAADAGSVALTGSAAALASALMKVSEGIAAIPSQDLRVASARDAFHLLPAARRKVTDSEDLDAEDEIVEPPKGLLATHPRLQARIARLEKLEHAIQKSR
jgi:heat shock protein HtpX